MLLSARFALVAVAAPSMCLAAIAADLPPATLLEPAVITATRAPLPAADVLASLIVIDRAEIEATQSRDLADLLSRRAGIEVARSGGPGQIASVFIRGGNSAHTLVLIDGVRVNPATSGAALNTIAPEMIERIEIIKGPRSTLYGSDALAGTINIITRGGDGSRYLGGYLRGGSHQTFSGGVSHAVGDEHAGLAISVARDRTRGIPAFAGATDPAGQDLRTANLKGNLKLGGLKLSAQAWRSMGDGEYQDAQRLFDENFNVVGVSAYSNFHQRTLNQTASVIAAVQPTANWQLSLQLAHSIDDLRQRENTDRVRTQRPELRLDNQIQFGLHHFGIGASAAQDRVDVNNGGTAINYVRDTKSVYALDQFDWQRWHAVLGGAYTDAEGFGSEPTYNAELGFDVLPGTRLIASAGSGFHAPDAASLYFPFYGNPNLKAEHGKSFEAGIKQAFAPGHTLELRAFQNDVRQLINFDLNTFAAGNVDRARTQGVELSWALAMGRWNARLEGSIQNPKNCSTDPNGNALSPSDCGRGSALTRRSRRGISGSLGYDFARGSVSVDWQGHVSRADFDAVSFNRVENPGYGLLNLSASVSLLPGLSIAARVENLLDHDYQPVAGYQASGTAAYLTLRYAQ